MKSFLSLFVLLLIAQCSFAQYSNTSFINQRYSLFNVANTAIDGNQINSSVGLLYNGKFNTTLLFEHELGKSNFALGGSSISSIMNNVNSNNLDVHGSYKTALAGDRFLSFGLGLGHRYTEYYYSSQYSDIKAMALRLGSSYKGQRLKIGFETGSDYNYITEYYRYYFQIFYSHKLIDRDNFDFTTSLFYTKRNTFYRFNLELEFLIKDSYEIIAGKNDRRGYYFGFNYKINEKIAVNLSSNLPGEYFLLNDYQFGLQLKL